jgi:hypothetical protein
LWTFPGAGESVTLHFMKDRTGGVVRWMAVAGLVVPACVLSFRAAHATPQPRDGSHDFDWEVGLWKTHLRALKQKADGTTAWVTYDGTSDVISIWNCRADMVQLDVVGPDGRHLHAINLRLYDPDSHQWSLNFSNAAAGVMGVPSIGEFRNGVGAFYDQESLGGRQVFIRGVWSNITATSAHFAQSVSDDGGKTWTLNWVADDTRVKGTTDVCAKGGAPSGGASASDGL